MIGGIVGGIDRLALLEFIDEGRRQLDEGEYSVYSEDELDAYFAELEKQVNEGVQALGDKS